MRVPYLTVGNNDAGKKKKRKKGTQIKLPRSYQMAHNIIVYTHKIDRRFINNIAPGYLFFQLEKKIKQCIKSLPPTNGPQLNLGLV